MSPTAHSEASCFGNLLPPEVVGLILSHLSDPRILQVCKQWYRLAYDAGQIFSSLKEKASELGISKEIDEASALQESSQKVKFIKAQLLEKLKPIILPEQMSHLTSLELSYPHFRQLIEMERNHNLLKAFQVLASKHPRLEELFAHPDFRAASLSKKSSKLRTLLNEIKEELIFSEIDLTHQELTLIPEELNLIQGVETIKLAFNNIREIPPHFGAHWTKLKELHLNDNKIQEIPEDFGMTWKEIHKLFLFSNKISSLPSNFGSSWLEIKNLILYRNKIESLPEGFGKNWKEAIEIDLSYNQLQVLPDDFGLQWTELLLLNVAKNVRKMELSKWNERWPSLLSLKD